MTLCAKRQDQQDCSTTGEVVQGEKRAKMVSCNNKESFCTLAVKRLSENAKLPQRGSAHAAGYDLFSATDITIPANGKCVVPTDISIAVPEGLYGRIAPRSGLAVKHFIDVGAGVIDPDYRGPLGIVLFNFSQTEFPVKRGDRIAQLILERIATPEIVEVDNLDETVRGEGGFGSSGISAAELEAKKPAPPTSTVASN